MRLKESPLAAEAEDLGVAAKGASQLASGKRDFKMRLKRLTMESRREQILILRPLPPPQG